MRKFLLYSSALVVLGLSGEAEAACIQTPTCSSLGYTSSSSCTGGVKCPFGNYWNCTASDLSDKITNLTNKITEVTNKITTIEEKIVTIENNTSSKTCLVGDILYSDMTCSSNPVSGKTPIGVVFDRSRKAIALWDASLISWSSPSFDVPGMSNITDETKALQDIDGKKNTSAMLAYCDANRKSCPLFERVNSYKTEGTKAGDWYIPALGELYAIYNNKGVLNVALGKIAATLLGESFSQNIYWSSSEYSDDSIWVLNFELGIVEEAYKTHDRYVRFVLAF